MLTQMNYTTVKQYGRNPLRENIFPGKILETLIQINISTMVSGNRFFFTFRLAVVNSLWTTKHRIN